MKRSKRLTLLLAIVFVCALVCATLYGCIDPPTYPLTELSWVTMPKTLYFVGDEFNSGDALIQAVYDNDPTRRQVLALKDIPTDEYQLVGFSTAERAMGGIEVKLVYKGFELLFNIKVIEPSDIKTITFLPMNGGEPFTQNVVVGETAVKPADPVKPNLVLEAWLNEDNSVFNFNTAIVEDRTLSARYASAYSFYVGGKDPLRTVLTTEGQDFDQTKLPSLTPRPGYTAYWCYNDTGKDVSFLTPAEMKTLKTVDQFYLSLTKNMRFDAIYIPETHTVTVDIMGGKFEDAPITEVLVAHGYTIASYFSDYKVLLENVFKEDKSVLYTFAGWYFRDESGFTQKVDFNNTLIEDDVTIYARWQYAVVFLTADVWVDEVSGIKVLRVKNDYKQFEPSSERYHKVMVDDGKAPSAQQIPTGTALETPGYQRWWSNALPAFQPDGSGAVYLSDMVSIDNISSTVGSPSTTALVYFEVFYQTKYRVQFDAQGGTAVSGIQMQIDNLTYGKGILSNQVPNREGMSYNKDGKKLEFFAWYYDTEFSIEFISADYRVNDNNVIFAVEGSDYIGTLTLRADYFAKIDWVNQYATDGNPSGGRIPEENARLSKNNVTRRTLPTLSSSASHDFDWYVDDLGTSAAFPIESNGIILKLTESTLYAVRSAKQYDMNFESNIAYDGGVQAVPIPNSEQRVNYGQPFVLPASFFHFDGTVEMPGFLDPTGKWQIEGYYKTRDFKERFTFENQVAPDGTITVVSKETFVSDTVVYVRWVRVGTVGLTYMSYALDSYHVTRNASLSALDEIVIPETYLGMPIIGIDVGAFENFKALSNLILPKGIIDIRDNAFRGCESLLSVPKFEKDAKLGANVLHNTDWYRQSWVTAKTSGLKYILLNDTVFYEYDPQSVVSEAFIIPRGIEIIASYAFNQSAITQITLPQSLQSIWKYAFYKMPNLTAIAGEHLTDSEGARIRSNLQMIEANSFYQLEKLAEIDLFGKSYQTFDNVLYRISEDRKTALTLYPTARAAEQFDKDGTYQSFYIIDEYVAQIEEGAFFNSSLNILVFKRGNNSLTATTVPSEFATSLKRSFSEAETNLVFYVPYHEVTDNASGQVELVLNANYTSGVWGEVGKILGNRLLPDAIEVTFVSPQQENKSWDSSRYFGFGDLLLPYRPDEAKTLTMVGMFGNYNSTQPEFSNPMDENSCAYYKRNVYQKWIAKMTFTDRDGNNTVFDVDYKTELTEDMLSGIQIKAVAGKDSEWGGTFLVWNGSSSEMIEMTFGDFKGIKVLYGGVYTIKDKNVVYNVYFKDPLDPSGSTLANTQVTYGGTISENLVNEPTRNGLTFEGWYLGTADGITQFNEFLIFGDNGTALNVNSLSGYEGERDQYNQIPIYLYARWQVIFSFYESSISADGTVTPNRTVNFTVRADYGGKVVGGKPNPFDGFRAFWSVYDEHGVLVEADESLFQNVTENKNIYANYFRMTVIVNFIVQSNPPVTQMLTTDYGTVLKSKPTAPTSYVLNNVTYTFEDWYYEESFVTRYHALDTFRKDSTNLYAKFVAEAPNVYVQGGFNKAGLWFEEIGAGSENRQFRLFSAANYSDETLFIPEMLMDEQGQRLGYVTGVGSSAFQNNNVLRHIIFGYSISTIASGAFQGANNLLKFTVDSKNGTYKSVDGILFESSKLLRYPSKSPNEFYKVPLEISEVASFAFENAQNLKSISFVSDTIPRLGDDVFRGIDMDISSGFAIYVPSRSLSGYRANSDWIRNIGVNNVGRVIVGDSITVSFVNPFNNSQIFNSVNITLGGTIVDPGYVAVAQGYSFNTNVWCDEFDTPYLFGQTVNRSITLFARMVRTATDGLKYTEMYRTGTNEIEGYAVSIGSATAKNIVIPNFYSNRPVLKILENGFLNSNLESIEIPYTVKEIGAGALKDLRQLKNIQLAEPGRLRSAHFAVINNVLYNKDITKVLLYPANSENGVTDYKTPASVTAIGDEAFYGNRVLRTVTLGVGVLQIGYEAFRLSQLSSLSILALQVVSLADGNALLEMPSSLLIFVPFENGMLNYYQNQSAGSGWYAYRAKIYATKATIEYRTLADGASDLMLWKSETQDTFKTVKEPDYSTLPPRLGKIFRYWKVQSTGARWSFDTDILKQDLVLVAEWIDATEETLFIDRTSTSETASLGFIGGDSTNITNLVIPSTFGGKTVRSIAAEGFMGLRNLSTVVLPVTLITIGASAFKDCISLKGVLFPESVQTLGANSFENCQSLESIRLPSNISVIQAEVFKSCTRLTSFDFGKSSITTLGNGAFYGCSALSSITLPKSLTTIGNETFRNVREIQTLTIPENVKTIGNGAFYAMTKLSSVLFSGNNIKDIGIGAFQACSALMTIKLPTSINAISSNMFFGASRLNSIHLGDNIIAIGVGAFEDCIALTSFTGGEFLEEIQDRAFANTSISTLTLGERLKMIKPNAFQSNLQLRSVFIKSIHLESIGEKIFLNCINFTIYAETQDIYNNLKVNANFKDYDKILKTRFSTLTYSFANDDGIDVTVNKVYLTDQKVSDEDLKTMNIGQPKSGEYYRYTFSHWTYFVTVEEDEKAVVYEYEWKFNSTVLNINTTIYARYIISPEEGTSDGLRYRGFTGNTWEVSQIGTQINRSIVVIPNYYQGLPVVSIGSGFLNNANSIETLVIPETITSIKADALRSSSIGKIVIVNNDENKNFRVVDNALYRINPKLPGKSDHSVTLLRYPAKLDGERGIYTLKTPAFEVDNHAVWLADLAEYAFEFNNIKGYEISVGDEIGQRYTAFDGVLYNEAKSTLISYPNYKELKSDGQFVIIGSVSSIGKAALSLTDKSEIQKFTVETGNIVFLADELGALYRKEGTEYTLVRVPTRFMSDTPVSKRNYEVTQVQLADGTKADVTTVAAGAFANVDLNTIIFGNTQKAPRLESADAFLGCNAKILIDNVMYATSQYVGNWSSLILYPRTSYLIFDTSEFIPQEFSNRYLPASYSGIKDGFVVEMSTFSQMQDIMLPTEIVGLMRLAYSEIVGWFYDEALINPAIKDGKYNYIERDVRLYPQWVVRSKASPPSMVDGKEQECFTFIPAVTANDEPAYVVRFNENSDIKQRKVIAIPSHYNGFPVIGFDRAIKNAYKGYVNLEILVIPETFTRLFNIWDQNIDVSQQPKNWKYMAFLTKNPIFGFTGNQDSSADQQDLGLFFTAGSAVRYYFPDVQTKERFRKQTLWTSSVGLRGSIIRSRLTFRAFAPNGSVLLDEFYLNIQTGVETLFDVYGEDGRVPKKIPEGYQFDGWMLDGKLIDPTVTTFIAPESSDLYGLVLEAKFSKIV